MFYMILENIISLVRSQSGTGKTATFAISCLQMIDTTVRETQALILAPTRELAQQIQKVNLLFRVMLVIHIIYIYKYVLFRLS